MSIDARRPRVLAFIRAWSPALAPHELAAIHAHLRRLGAELAICAEAGAWWLGPDDEIRPYLPDELARFAGRAPGHDAVIVLDSAGQVRFAHDADGPLEASLAGALAPAGEALLARPAAACRRISGGAARPTPRAATSRPASARRRIGPDAA